MPSLSSIYCYPVKGLNGIRLQQTSLESGYGIKHDRKFAITRNIQSTYDGHWRPSANFIGNQKDDKLPLIKLSQEEDGTLTIKGENGNKIAFHPDRDLDDGNVLPDVASVVETLELPADFSNPRLIRHSGGTGKAMWDYPETSLSIINLETVKDVEQSLGKPVDPRRFRGNLIIGDLEPWSEFSLLGKFIKLGNSVLEILRPIDRCPATSLHPEKAIRDVDMPKHLHQTYGHVFCGVYARVIKGGSIEIDNEFALSEHTLIKDQEHEDQNGPDYALWPRQASIVERRELGDTVLLAIAGSNLAPLPSASIGQRVRFHMKAKCWTGSTIIQKTQTSWMVEVEPSRTADPATEYLRFGYDAGSPICISGPYGRTT